MSKEEQVRPAAPAAPTTADESDDDLLLQVNLRLKLDEIAELKASTLRLKAQRKPTRSELCRLACRMYDARRFREKEFNGELFGEPAWDFLLSLYCLPARGELLTVTSLSYAAAVPPTTGLRWQKLLEDEGLIERGPKGVDKRKQMIRLTTNGRSLMDAYLTRLFYCDAPTPPHPELAGG